MALPVFRRWTGTGFSNSLSEIVQPAEEGSYSPWYTSKNHLTQPVLVPQGKTSLTLTVIRPSQFLRLLREAEHEVSFWPPE